jgi:hypothetical protein
MSEPAARPRLCFVIGPLGDSDSDTRIHADWLLEEIIDPVFKEFPDYEVVRADKIAEPGMIDAQIIRYLIDADLVIADLSALNPNAFYEIGIRHMVQKPIIHMQLVEDKIPFDVSLYRATKFSRRRPSDLRRARDELRQMVVAIGVPGYAVDNPVTRARGQIALEQHATPEQQVLMEQVRSIQGRLAAVEERTLAQRTDRHPRRKSKAKEPSEVEAVVIELSETESDIKLTRARVAERIAKEDFLFNVNEYEVVVPGDLWQLDDFWREISLIEGVKSVYPKC